MSRSRLATVVFLGVGLVVFAPFVPAQEAQQSEREAMYYRYLEFASYVKGGSIEPHWMADASSFWYVEGAPANTVIYKVDPTANTKTPLLDTVRLREALTPLLGHEPPYQGLPFEEFTFVNEGEQAVKFSVEDKEFILQLETYAITRAPALSEEEETRSTPQAGEVLSPDGQWFAGIKDHNLWLRSTYDGRSVQITTDGVEDHEWVASTWWIGPAIKWSPNSLKLSVVRVDYRNVPQAPIVHWLKPRPEVEWVRDGAAQTELFIVDILSNRQVRIDTGEELDQTIRILGWQPDGSELLLTRLNSGATKLDLLAANPITGATRVILTETQEPFIYFSLRDIHFTPLGHGKRFIWMSERDDWSHLYLYEEDGTLVRRLTQGTFPVSRVVAVDEKAGWIYFTAQGDQQRLYDTHLYRVSLEGKEFTQLTRTTGQHEIQFAPSKEFFIDTHSTVDRPPTVELRKADGTLLRTLSEANIDSLHSELRWSPPEEFVVKAADGETDLYGVLYKPYDFDPNKKYPVIEVIYGAAAEVPNTFTHPHGVDFHAEHAQALAQLGFITFLVDNRAIWGRERGKKFWSEIYGNIGRHEIPDHLATLKQLAEERPYMDLSRVGIFGHSWGGYFTIRALLLAPDVYHVGIASAPAPELLDVAGGEPWLVAGMGSPHNNKEGYEYSSNLRFAGNLKGKLLLIHGTSDITPLFSQTMKMVEALIRAGKPYDLIVFPEQGHSYTGTNRTYRREAVRRYFQEHLKPEG